MTRVTCHPHGFDSATLCDEYYGYSDKPKGKIRGFCFWFEDCFCPPIYFVPCDEPYSGRELSLQDALEAWIDYLFTAKSCDVVGGGYEGSQSFGEYAIECEDPELERVTFGASFYAIDSESWKCAETWIAADGVNDYSAPLETETDMERARR